jgi:hypothetical protein
MKHTRFQMLVTIAVFAVLATPAFTSTGHSPQGDISVLITGFSVPNSFARASACPVVNHQATCYAQVSPANASEIIFSIIGDTHGATINATSGIITPSITQSGTIIVRATAAINSNIYDEKPFLIKARPTSINRSTVEMTMVVGGKWRHTFDGTGGCLDGSILRESITMSNWPFREYYPNTDSEHWVLDEYGTMKTGDLINEPVYKFDVTDFLPTPGLPQSSLEHQRFRWACPSCWGALRDIEQGPAYITFSLFEDAQSPYGYAVTITTGYGAEGEPIYFNYYGPTPP